MRFLKMTIQWPNGDTLKIQAKGPSDHVDAPIEYIGARKLEYFQFPNFQLGAIPYFVEKAAEKEGAIIADGELIGRGADI